jgi:hypothetical protein
MTINARPRVRMACEVLTKNNPAAARLSESKSLKI